MDAGLVDAEAGDSAARGQDGGLPFSTADPADQPSTGFERRKAAALSTLERAATADGESVACLLVLAKAGKLDAAALDPSKGALSRLLADARAQREKVDFSLIELTRLLHLTKSTSDGSFGMSGAAAAEHAAMAALAQVQYTPHEGLQPGHGHCWWSENHFICYASTEYLHLQRLADAEGDDSLGVEHMLRRSRCQQKVLFYCRLKAEHGFFELFSPVYLPYTLMALLNLADFADDGAVRGAAAASARRLLLEVSLMSAANAYLVPSNRTYRRFYEQAPGAGTNIIQLQALVAGAASEVPCDGIAAVFLATSDLQLSDASVDASRRAIDHLGWNNGIGSKDLAARLLELPAGIDRSMQLFSSGLYFHRHVVADNAQALKDTGLVAHKHFAPISPVLSHLPAFALPLAAKAASAVTDGMNISFSRVVISKDENLLLSSLQDFNAGAIGAQQLPMCANVGGVPVVLRSGSGGPGGALTGEENQSARLPCCKQVGGMLLVMYEPLALVPWLLSTVTRMPVLAGEPSMVSLQWSDALETTSVATAEVRNLQNEWIVGSKDGAYVAVLPPVGFERGEGGAVTCSAETQLWCIIVGSESRHGSLDAFIAQVRGTRLEAVGCAAHERLGTWLQVPWLEATVSLFGLEETVTVPRTMRRTVRSVTFLLIVALAVLKLFQMLLGGSFEGTGNEAVQ